MAMWSRAARVLVTRVRSGDQRLPPGTSANLGEPDRQAEGHPVSGEGQDLVSEQGVGDAPGAPGSVGAVVQL